MRTGGDILPGTPPRSHRVAVGLRYEAWEASSSDPELLYHVTQDADGNWDCTCPAVEFGSRADGLCKHIDKHRRRAAEPVTVLAGRL